MTELFTGLLLASTTIYVGVALLFWHGLYRIFIVDNASENPFISVVIAARNEADFIGNCLHSLSQQTYPTDRFEVIVIDDASTDDTQKIATSFIKSLPNLHVIEVGQAFLHMAAKKRPMSVGIQHARGEWIATTDADCRVLPTWLSGLSKYMHPHVGAIIGFSQIKTPTEKLTFFERLQAFDFLTLMAAAAGAAGLGFPLAASGQNWAYRKSLFEKVGGFSSISHRPSGDDVLLLQLLRHAWSGLIVFAKNPNTFVQTWRTETPTSFFRQRLRWASNAAYQLKLNPIFFGYITSVFLLNTLILLSLSGIVSLSLSFGCALAKITADFLVTQKSAQDFNRKDVMPMLLIWEVFQLPYTLLVGLVGTLGKFTWKGRQHR